MFNVRPQLGYPAATRRGATVMPLLCVMVVAMFLQVSVTEASDDPLEPVNRAVFKFNNTADKYVVKPLAKGYVKVLPAPARTGVTNFFGNFLDVNGAFNALLQGRLAYSFQNFQRVLVNSTLGFFGFFDVATDMGIPRYQTDFGHTLAIWGTPPGAYVMLPLLGPRTLRSGTGSLVDGYATPMTYIDPQETQWTLRGLEIVNLRAGLLGADELLSGDQYIFIRDAYLQRRQALTSEEDVVDDFSAFDDDWEADEL